jgi:DnaJ family protein A protein 3
MPVGKKEVFITFRVEKSDYFRRDGADVHTDANISLSQAVLGGTIRVRGIYEDQTIQVPYYCKISYPRCRDPLTLLM